MKIGCVECNKEEEETIFSLSQIRDIQMIEDLVNSVIFLSMRKNKILLLDVYNSNSQDWHSYEKVHHFEFQSIFLILFLRES